MSDDIAKMARETADRIEGGVRKQLRSANTLAPVIIENIHLDPETGIPTTCDVRMKHEPEGTLIPGCPILGAMGCAEGVEGGTFMPPIVEGMVATGLFSMVPLDDLILDATATANTKRGRFKARVDCQVLPFSFFPVNEIFTAAPDGYDPEDFLIQHPDVGVIWMHKAQGRLYLGDPTSAQPVLVDGDSNGAGGVSASQDTVYAG